MGERCGGKRIRSQKSIKLNHVLSNQIQNTSKEIIGKRIRSLRKLKGMTMQELADGVNADRQYIWQIETGKVNITLDYLDKIIALLGCKREEFFAKAG